MDRAFAGAASAKSDRDNFEQECAVVNFPKNPVLRNAQAIYSSYILVRVFTKLL